VTWVSHAINRKGYLKEKKNRNELSTEAVHDRRLNGIIYYHPSQEYRLIR